MKSSVKLFIVCSLLFFVCSCGVQKTGKREEKFSFSSKEQELEYYYAFTEATKQAMFSNYKDAINLYNKCLKYNPNSAATHFQLSNIYFRMGELELAKIFGQKAIKRDDRNIWYYLHLASIYQIQRNIDSTIVVYEKIVDLDKSKTEYLFNLALLYNEKGDYEKALKAIKKVETESGVSERMIYLKHDLYSKLGKRKDAIKELANGIGQFPENINLYGLLAEYYAEIGEYENADSLYECILKKDSVNMNVKLSYADYLLGMGRKDCAFKLYQSTIEDNDISASDKIKIIIPMINDDKIFNNSVGELGSLTEKLKERYLNNEEVRFVCIDFNIKAGNYKNASEDLQFVVNKEPGNLNAWKQLVYIENFISNYDSVISYSDKALNIFSEEVTFFIMKGLALLQKGENSNAIDVLLESQRYALRKEEKIQIYGYLGELYRNIGNNDQSDNFFEKALEMDKENILIRNNYSYYLALRDTALKKAERLSRLTIEKEPDNATYLDTYAWIIFKMGKAKQALKYIERAVKYDNAGNTEIFEHYGDILFKLSRYGEAIEIWNRIFEKDASNLQLREKLVKAKDLIKEK